MVSEDHELKNESPQGKVKTSCQELKAKYSLRGRQCRTYMVQTHLIKINLEIVKVKERGWPWSHGERGKRRARDESKKGESLRE